MIRVFIDSNIWLSLYSFTSDDIQRFSRLKELINESIKLYVPEQVIVLK